jgi:hypothetical protein
MPTELHRLKTPGRGFDSRRVHHICAPRFYGPVAQWTEREVFRHHLAVTAFQGRQENGRGECPRDYIGTEWRPDIPAVSVRRELLRLVTPLSPRPLRMNMKPYGGARLSSAQAPGKAGNHRPESHPGMGANVGRGLCGCTETASEGRVGKRFLNRSAAVGNASVPCLRGFESRRLHQPRSDEKE